MSTGIDSLRAYFNFSGNPRKRSASRAATTTAPFAHWDREDSAAINPSRPRSRSSAPLPTMAQSQRTRYVKATAIIAALLLVVFWFSPSKPAVAGFHRQQEQPSQGISFPYPVLNNLPN